MKETKQSNGKARVIVVASLLLLFGSLVAMPTASAATVARGGGGCVSSYVADPGGSTWEILLGKVGRLIDCIV